LFLTILLGFVGNGVARPFIFPVQSRLAGETYVFGLTPAQEMNISLEVDLRAVPEGFNVTLSGNVKLSTGAGTFAEVSITIRNPLGTTICIRDTFTDSQGAFRSFCVITAPSPCGQYPIDVTASRGTLHVSQHASVAVGCADFSMSIAPGSGSVEQGGTVSFNVTITPSTGFNSPVYLTVQNPPDNTTVSFSPSEILLPTTSAKLDIATSPATPLGTFNVTLVATGGGIEHTEKISLSIRPAGNSTSQLTYWLLAVLVLAVAALGVIVYVRRRSKEPSLDFALAEGKDALAVVRALTKLEELRALGKLEPGEYERLKKEYDRRLETLKKNK